MQPNLLVPHQMLNRLRVRDWPGRKRRLEFAFYFAEVREIALHTKFFRLCSPSENHMHSLGHFALNRRYEFGIETELNQRPRLSRFRELRPRLRRTRHRARWAFQRG